MNRNELFVAIEKKFEVEECVVLLFADFSGGFYEYEFGMNAGRELLSFDSYDLLTVEKIENCKLDDDGNYWVTQ